MVVNSIELSNHSRVPLKSTQSNTGSVIYSSGYDASSISSLLSPLTIGSDGVLIPSQVSVTAGGYYTTLTASPNSKWVYAIDTCGTGDCNDNKGVINTYAAAENGDLNYVSTMNMKAPYSMAIDPWSKYAYIINASDAISQFAIDSASGTLSLKNTLKVNDTLRSVVVSPSGYFLYLGSYGKKAYSYTINPQDGSLKLVSSVKLSGIANTMVAHPNGKFLFAMSGHDIQTIYVPNSGVMEVVSAQSIGNTNSTNIALSRDGNALYVVTDEARIITYSVNSTTGVLTQIDTVSLSAKAIQHGIVIDETGSYLYIGISNNNILISKIDPVNNKLSYIDTIPSPQNKQLLSLLNQPNKDLSDSAGVDISSDTNNVDLWWDTPSKSVIFSITNFSSVDVVNTSFYTVITNAGENGYMTTLDFSIENNTCGTIIPAHTTCNVSVLVNSYSSGTGGSFVLSASSSTLANSPISNPVSVTLH